ncbi:MAG: hypothetical protein ACLTKT_06300 [Clostridia bacterium]|nr:stage III sporulation protein AB [Clostridium sp.]
MYLKTKEERNELEMQMIKYMMLVIIFISSTLIGKFLSKKYTYRLEELEEMQNALNIFKSKIKFTYEPISDIFNDIAKNSIPNISKIFAKARYKMNELSAEESWQETIEEVETNLNEEDIHAISMLSKMLGQTDVEGQISQIEITRRIFRKSNKTSKRRKKQK